MTRSHQLYGGKICPPDAIPPTWGAVLMTVAQESGEFVSRYGDSDRKESLSYGEYVRQSVRFAQVMRSDFAVERGTPIAVQKQNSIEALVAYGALLYLGCPIVAIPPRLPIKAVKSRMMQTGARFLISDSPSEEIFSIAFRKLNQTDSALPNVEPLGPCTDSNAIAAIVWTSGTTGNPKPVPLTHQALMVTATALVDAYEIDEWHVHGAVLPLFQAPAFCLSFLAIFLARARLVLIEPFTPKDFWNVIAAEKIQTVNVVPELVQCLNQAGTSCPAKRESVRYFLSSAAPLSRSDLTRFIQLHKIPLLQGYGLTEAASFSLGLPPSLSEETYRTWMIDSPQPSIGCPLWGNEVQIHSPEGNQLPEGEVGEIVLRGWNLMQGYADADIGDTQFRDGWLCTGDLGFYRRDKDGERYFFFVGRRKAGEAGSVSQTFTTQNLFSEKASV